MATGGGVGRGGIKKLWCIGGTFRILYKGGGAKTTVEEFLGGGTPVNVNVHVRVYGVITEVFPLT